MLDAFDALTPFLTLAQITQRSGLAHATAHRLVAELERERLVERTPDGAYRLGLRLWELGSRTPGGFGLREIARPFMAAVHTRVRQHTQLGILSGRDVLFIERMSTRDAVINATLVGGRMPLPLSSSGLILLAHAERAVLDDVVATGWPTPTPAAIRGEDALVCRLRRARADGFVVADGFIHEGSRGIAVPVMAPNRHPFAALGVVVPNDGADPAPTIELLAQAASALAAALQDASLPDAVRGRTPVFGPLISSSTATLDYFAHRTAAPKE
ncbi:IclR family transcriptional regulator [Microbacterium hominis]|uniref:IclR family transcriptional regulator n=1 Tax=Microbacterium hominis TaxID=162426 RepID=A0A7D4Q9V9_9MICO|nr:IclR family transcriptional regulator [Microbacterium hominis]